MKQTDARLMTVLAWQPVRPICFYRVGSAAGRCAGQRRSAHALAQTYGAMRDHARRALAEQLRARPLRNPGGHWSQKPCCSSWPGQPALRTGAGPDGYRQGGRVSTISGTRSPASPARIAPDVDFRLRAHERFCASGGAWLRWQALDRQAATPLVHRFDARTGRILAGQGLTSTRATRWQTGKRLGGPWPGQQFARPRCRRCAWRPPPAQRRHLAWGQP